MTQPEPRTDMNVQAFLNACAAIGERVYRISCLQAEIEEGKKKAAEFEQKILADNAQAIEKMRAEAEKEADKVTG